HECWAARAVRPARAGGAGPMQHRGQFALRQRPLDAGEGSLNPAQAALWTRLADGPQPLDGLVSGPAALRALGRLVDRGLVLLSGFTPSDAAHLLGRQQGWSVGAAPVGAPPVCPRRTQGGARPAAGP